MPVNFNIDSYSFTIPYPMTWKEVIDNPNVVICNTDVGIRGHYFNPKPAMTCSVDESLYYIEEDGRILGDYCTQCWHIEPNPCSEQETFCLLDDENNFVNLNDKIKTLRYILYGE